MLFEIYKLFLIFIIMSQYNKNTIFKESFTKLFLAKLVDNKKLDKDILNWFCIYKGLKK